MTDNASQDSAVSGQSGRVVYFFIALAPFLAIFALVPLELYTNAVEYWRWNMEFLGSFIFAGATLYAILVLLLYVLSLFRANALRVSSLALFYLGIYLLLADVLAPLQTGLLDGSALESDEPFFYTALELFLLGFVLFFAVKFRRHAVRIATLMTLFLLALAAAYFFYASMLKSPDKSPGLPVVEASSAPTGNIYHIVLDEMQSDATLGYIQQAGLQDDLEGFTFYENNIGNYLFTNVSMPSYLTGKLYRTGDFPRWQQSYKEQGVFRRLYEEGYKVDLYAVYDHWCSPYAHNCVSLDEIFEQKTGLLGADFITFIQIWFARVSPNVVSNQALALGKQLGEFVDARMNAGADDIPKTIARGRAPYSSVLMLDELIATERDRPSTGQYIYAHTILPHGPYVINEDCEYDGTMWKTLGGKRAYYQQTRCALNKVMEFLDELKRLDRYGDASIVIHADTGHGHQGFIRVDENDAVQESIGSASPPVELDKKFIKSEEWYLSRGMALLMIKPPQAAGSLVFSKDWSQLVDVYPTILAMADLTPSEANELDGIDLLGADQAAMRETHMYFTTPARVGDVTTLTLSDRGNIAASRLIIEDNSQTVNQADRYTVSFGVNDAGLELVGFSYGEQLDDGSRHWRWATGASSSIDLSSHLRLSPGRYLVSFELEPFGINEGASLGITIGDVSHEVTMKPGWQPYQLQYEFTREQQALIRFDFEKATSPQSLGMSADQRELAARFQMLEIRPTE